MFNPQDQAFIEDSATSILHALASSSQQNRVQASWALANLTDALINCDRDYSLPSYSRLLSAARNALKDKDVVGAHYYAISGDVSGILSNR